MLIGLVVYAVVTICSPGAANLLAADSGARAGVRGSAPLLAGLAGTVLAIIAVCAAGVGGVVAAAPAARTVLRAAGSAYLLRLAWHVLRSGRPEAVERGRAATFTTGVLSTLVNPKTWTVGLGAAAGFSGLAAGPAALTGLLVGVFAAVVVPNLIGWAFLGQRISRRLTSERRWRVYRAVLAGLLATSVAAIWME